MNLMVAVRLRILVDVKVGHPRFSSTCLLPRCLMISATLRENRTRGSEAMRHWPEPREGDVRDFSFKLFEDRVDLVTGGPPCQPFSLGERHQADRDHRDMWSEAVRSVRETRPSAFIFENVNFARRTISALDWRLD